MDRHQLKRCESNRLSQFWRAWIRSQLTFKPAELLSTTPYVVPKAVEPLWFGSSLGENAGKHIGAGIDNAGKHIGNGIGNGIENAGQKVGENIKAAGDGIGKRMETGMIGAGKRMETGMIGAGKNIGLGMTIGLTFLSLAYYFKK